MVKAIYRITAGSGNEWLEEIALHIGNYTIFCCKEEITLKLNKGISFAVCKKCNKRFKTKFEGFIESI